MPTAPPEFIIAPLLKVPPASRGEPRKARPLGSPCEQGEPQGGGQLQFFVNAGSAIGIRGVQTGQMRHKTPRRVYSRDTHRAHRRER
jgi:hypothetical protein